MASVNGFVARLRGDRTTALIAQTAALADQVAALDQVVQALNHQVGVLAAQQREQLGELNHAAQSMNHAVARSAELTEAHHAVLLELNHDVRAGSERALPLFLGYAERLRLDTDTAIGAAQVIERQLALLEDLVAARDEPAAT
ncbi:MAG: hypothetical protein ACR2O6_10545 [Ilumatobacteraceae bacterium]